MGRTSVALTRPGEPVLVKRIESGRAAGRAAYSADRRLMEEALSLSKRLNRVAVCIGPGGFSGIRTGVAAGRGIGLAARLPVVGATSFRIMAAAFEKMPQVPETYGLAAPAGMNAVYCQIVARGGKPVTDIMALPQSECVAFFEGKAAGLGRACCRSSIGHRVCHPPRHGSYLTRRRHPCRHSRRASIPNAMRPRPITSATRMRRPQTKHVIALETD